MDGNMWEVAYSYDNEKSSKYVEINVIQVNDKKMKEKLPWLNSKILELSCGILARYSATIVAPAVLSPLTTSYQTHTWISRDSVPVTLSFSSRPPPLRWWVAGWGFYWLRLAPPPIQPLCTTTTSTLRPPPMSSSWPSSPSGEGRTHVL